MLSMSRMEASTFERVKGCNDNLTESLHPLLLVLTMVMLMMKRFHDAQDNTSGRPAICSCSFSLSSQIFKHVLYMNVKRVAELV